jgi:uncharacterized repeat protein (TIGR03803 family)
MNGAMKTLAPTLLLLSILACVKICICNAAEADGTGFQVLYAFPTATGELRLPHNSLVEGEDQQFYGTAWVGGPTDFDGGVYKISKGGQFTPLIYFDGTNGRSPRGGLVRGPDGSFFGVVNGGATSSNNNGSIYRITMNGGFSVLKTFSVSTNGSPEALTLAPDGSLYGVTFGGGTFGWGSIFRFLTNGSFTPLYSFPVESAYPSKLAWGPDGWLYGTTGGSGGSRGTAFKFSTNGQLVTLAQFNGTNGSGPNGVPIIGKDGKLYGTTGGGGRFGFGTLFSITTNGTLSTLIHFDGTNGMWPDSVIQSRDGFLYGVTIITSTNLLYGTIFRCTTNGVLTTVVRLDGTNGTRPYWSLVQSSDGSIYGALGDAMKKLPLINGGTFVRFEEQPTIASIVGNSTEATLTWHSFTNRSYQVEYRQSLGETQWNRLEDVIVAQSDRTSFTVPNLGSPQRYYRVVLLP